MKYNLSILSATINKVDYALIAEGKVKMFIEAKNQGENLEKHQEQLLNYAFKYGIQIAILTNGIIWWFYLPLREGNWEQRRFYVLELHAHSSKEIAQNFVDFLAKEHVLSGAAMKNADNIYRTNQITEALPKAWNQIIRDPTLQGLMTEELVETTEKLCGYKPEKDEATDFLSALIPQISLSENWKALPKEEPDTTSGQNDDKSIYEGRYNPQSVEFFFKYVKEVEDLIATKGWALKTKLNRYYCVFKLGNRNVFGISWIGTKTFAFFANITEDEARKLEIPYTKYDRQYKEVRYYIAPQTTNTEDFTSVFEFAYQKFSTKSTEQTTAEKSEKLGYTGQTITAFTLEGNRYEVKSWKEVLVKVCEIMATTHSNEFEEVFDLKGTKLLYFSRNPEDLVEPRSINGTDIYVGTQMGSNRLISISQKVISLFGYEKDTLLIETTEKPNESL